MRLEYSELPNIKGTILWGRNYAKDQNGQTKEGAFCWTTGIGKGRYETVDQENIFMSDPKFNASWSSSIYSDAITKPQVDGIFGLMLIRGF